MTRQWSALRDSHALVAKSSVAEYKKWMSDSFGRRTPWGDEDSPALVTAVETQLERQLQDGIMRGGVKPHIRCVKEGKTLEGQGSESSELFLLLNGVLVVDVDGEQLDEFGPGAVLGERAIPPSSPNWPIGIGGRKPVRDDGDRVVEASPLVTSPRRMNWSGAGISERYRPANSPAGILRMSPAAS